MIARWHPFTGAVAKQEFFLTPKLNREPQGPATDRPDALVVTHGGTLAIERGI